MITHLLFDFNNVILFADGPSEDIVGTLSTKVAVPGSHTGFFYLNQELLNHIKQIKDDGISTAILSASEYSLYQPSVQEIISPYFDQIFLSKELGLPKDLPASYMKTAEKMGVDVSNVLFIDDKLDNCNAAEAAGMSVIHYQSNHDLFKAFEKFLTLQLIKVS